jgi:hypothetical protein
MPSPGWRPCNNYNPYEHEKDPDDNEEEFDHYGRRKVKKYYEW